MQSSGPLKEDRLSLCWLRQHRMWLYHYCTYSSKWPPFIQICVSSTSKSCGIWEPKRLLYIQCLLNTCIPAENSRVHSAPHHIMHTGTEVAGKEYCDNCTINKQDTFPSFVTTGSSSKPYVPSPYI